MDLSGRIYSKNRKEGKDEICVDCRGLTIFGMCIQKVAWDRINMSISCRQPQIASPDDPKFRSQS